MIDKDFSLILEQDNLEDKKYNIRHAVRAIVFDSDKKIALQYFQCFDKFMIPGGGVEEWEGLESAIRREIREEAGVSISDLSVLWKTIEYFLVPKDIKNISYCFTANVFGEKWKLQLEKNEIEGGASIHWFSLDEAIKIISWHSNLDINGRAIQRRDLALFEEVKKRWY